MTLLPFAVLLSLFAASAFVAGLGYRRLGEALAISTAVSPATGFMAGVAALILVLRVRLDSYAPGLSVAAEIFRALVGASLITALLAIGTVAVRVARDRSYLADTGRSWGWLSLSVCIGIAALALGRV